MMLKRILGAVLIAALSAGTALVVASGKAASVADRYTDVSAGNRHREAIQWAVDTRLMLGLTATEWGPTEPVSRQQLATILYRYHNRFVGSGRTGGHRPGHHPWIPRDRLLPLRPLRGRLRPPLRHRLPLRCRVTQVFVNHKRLLSSNLNRQTHPPSRNDRGNRRRCV